MPYINKTGQFELTKGLTKSETRKPGIDDLAQLVYNQEENVAKLTKSIFKNKIINGNFDISAISPGSVNDEMLFDLDFRINSDNPPESNWFTSNSTPTYTSESIIADGTIAYYRNIAINPTQHVEVIARFKVSDNTSPQTLIQIGDTTYGMSLGINAGNVVHVVYYNGTRYERTLGINTNTWYRIVIATGGMFLINENDWSVTYNNTNVPTSNVNYQTIGQHLLGIDTTLSGTDVTSILTGTTYTANTGVHEGVNGEISYIQVGKYTTSINPYSGSMEPIISTWYCYQDAVNGNFAVLQKFRRDSYATFVSQVATGPLTVYTEHKQELVQDFIGKDYTLSFKYNAFSGRNIIIEIGYSFNSKQNTYTKQIYSGSITGEGELVLTFHLDNILNTTDYISPNVDYWFLRISLVDNNVALQIKEVQLEEGTVKTEFEYVPKEITKLLCSRYEFHQLYHVRVYVPSTAFYWPVISVKPLVPMRTVPSILWYNTFVSNVQRVNVNTIPDNNPSNTYIELTITPSASDVVVELITRVFLKAYP